MAMTAERMTAVREAAAREITAKLAEGQAQQQAGLSILLAEMTALSAMIPGLQPQHLRTEAEVEADFDNMPV